MQCLKNNDDHEMPHMLVERAIIRNRAVWARVGGAAFHLKGTGQMVAAAME